MKGIQFPFITTALSFSCTLTNTARAVKDKMMKNFNTFLVCVLASAFIATPSFAHNNSERQAYHLQRHASHHHTPLSRHDKLWVNRKHQASHRYSHPSAILRSRNTYKQTRHHIKKHGWHQRNKWRKYNEQRQQASYYHNNAYWLHSTNRYIKNRPSAINVYLKF